MRPSYSTITPSVVHHCARSVLEMTLGFQPYKQSVSRHQLLGLLLLVASATKTLFAIARRYFDFSHETARRAVYANLTTLPVLTQRLVDALHAVAALSRRDRRRLWTVAIDLHYVPYYGSKKTPGIIGGPKKQGTSFFHCYATAVFIHRRRRYTVGLLSVTKGLKPHEVVKTLLEQIGSRGLCVGGAVLDAGFDRGETILLLQEQGVSYTVPLRRKGKGTNRRNARYSQPSGTLWTMDWVTEKSRKPVQTRVRVWQRDGESQAQVYRRRYRERFGIETSYRPKNQSRGWTTSPRAEYRLLLEGLALVLRQVWVYLTQQIARDRGLRPRAWVSELPRVEMLNWLVEDIQNYYPHTRCITLDNNTLTITAPR